MADEIVVYSDTWPKGGPEASFRAKFKNLNTLLCYLVHFGTHFMEKFSPLSRNLKAATRHFGDRAFVVLVLFAKKVS